MRRLLRIEPSSFTVIGLFFSLAVVSLALAALWILFVAHPAGSSPIRDVFTDEEFWHTVWRTLSFAGMAIILKATLAWVMVPFFLNKSKTPTSWLLLIPWLIPTSVASLAWLWLFYDVGGGANLILQHFVGTNFNWLGRPSMAITILLALNVWRETPLWALALAPSIGGGRPSVETLSVLDDLGKFERFRLLVTPRVRPVILALAILSTIWTVGEFESVWLLTRGGPGQTTELITIYAFRHAFLSQDLARGAAAYVCFLPVMTCVLLMLFWFYRYSTERADA